MSSTRAVMATSSWRTIGVFVLLGPAVGFLVALLTLFGGGALFAALPIPDAVSAIIVSVTLPPFWLFAYLVGAIPALLSGAIIGALEARRTQPLNHIAVALVGAVSASLALLPALWRSETSLFEIGQDLARLHRPMVLALPLAGAIAALVCHHVAWRRLTPPPAP